MPPETPPVTPAQRPAHQAALAALADAPRTWLVTGAAGFIGSNLLEALLREGQTVRGLDSFATGYRHNLDDVRARVGEAAWRRCEFVEGDVADADTVERCLRGVDVVLHHAAFVSVPASLERPAETHRVNVTGFLQLLDAVRRRGGGRVVYAATSATYGDDPAPVKREDTIGAPLSPYALSKTMNELYAELYARVYGVETIGLRYFNVFGARQDPAGAYAAVIPAWVDRLLAGEPCVIHGDGETTRDFCHVDNVVQANLLAATVGDAARFGRVYNVGTGVSTTLNELFRGIRACVARLGDPAAAAAEPRYGPFRPGDVRHSKADIGRARAELGFEPVVGLEEGLARTVAWFLRGRGTPTP